MTEPPAAAAASLENRGLRSGLINQKQVELSGVAEKKKQNTANLKYIFSDCLFSLELNRKGL